jgi:predicted SAM-dependent methyltransferase
MIFELNETVEKECKNKFRPSGTFRCNLPTTFSDVWRTYLDKKFAVKQNLPIPNIEEVDGYGYVYIREIVRNGIKVRLYTTH